MELPVAAGTRSPWPVDLRGLFLAGGETPKKQ
jgi:hypothetical protein